MSDMQTAEGPQRGPGALAQAGPFAILAAGALWLLRIFYQLPERIPIHWNARFVADGFVARSRPAVLMPVFLGAPAINPRKKKRPRKR